MAVDVTATTYHAVYLPGMWKDCIGCTVETNKVVYFTCRLANKRTPTKCCTRLCGRCYTSLGGEHLVVFFAVPESSAELDVVELGLLVCAEMERSIRNMYTLAGKMVAREHIKRHHRELRKKYEALNLELKILELQIKSGEDAALREGLLVSDLV